MVDDGGHDLAAHAVTAAGATLLALPANRGKGAAVRAGMLAATGDVRAYTDVDIPFGSDCLRAIEYYVARRGFHVVIGDRTLPESRYRMSLTPVRRAASAVFTSLVGRVITGGFFDTQCGVKGFRADVATQLFSRSRVDRFAFDVELVYLALKGRLDIKRLSVVLENNETSSVRVVRDSWRMLVDLARIIVGQKTGRYATEELEALVSAEQASERQHWRGSRTDGSGTDP